MARKQKLSADEYLEREVAAGKAAAKKRTRVPKEKVVKAIKEKKIKFDLKDTDAGGYVVTAPDIRRDLKYPTMPCPNCGRSHAITPQCVGFMCNCRNEGKFTTVWLDKKGKPNGK